MDTKSVHGIYSPHDSLLLPLTIVCSNLVPVYTVPSHENMIRRFSNTLVDMCSCAAFFDSNVVVRMLVAN